MYNLTIRTIGNKLYYFANIPLNRARELVADMGTQVDSATFCKFNEPLLRIKG